MELVTTAAIRPFAKYGIDFVIPRSESVRVPALDAQRQLKKAVFGCGWIVSERVKAEREKAEREKAIIWQLSEREKAIIEKLNKAALNG